MAAERVVWYLWPESLVLAIPNNSGQSHRCMVTCLQKSRAKLVGDESQAPFSSMFLSTGYSEAILMFIYTRGDVSKIEMKLLQRCCEAFIEYLRRYRARSQTWNIHNLNKNANLATRETRPYEFSACFFGVHVIKRRSDWPESDWPELFGMARTKDSAQRYQLMNLSLPFLENGRRSNMIIPSVDLTPPAISPTIAQPDSWLYLAVGQVERSVTQPSASALGQSNFLQHCVDQSHHQR